MRDYILSLLLLTAFLGGYTALVLNHHTQPGHLHNQAAVELERTPSSNTEPSR